MSVSLQQSFAALLTFTLITASSGCGDLGAERRGVNTEAVGVANPDGDKPADDYPAPPGTKENQPPPVPKQENRFKRKTDLVVDMKAAMEKYPHLIEVENKITSGNYLGALAEGYFAASSRANVLAFQHSLDVAKQLTVDGDNLPFSEVQTYIKQHGVKFNELLPYQMYAYNQDTGKFTILEDPEMKKEYEAAKKK